MNVLKLPVLSCIRLLPGTSGRNRSVDIDLTDFLLSEAQRSNRLILGQLFSKDNSIEYTILNS
jgi:hypothetical protein